MNSEQQQQNMTKLKLIQPAFNETLDAEEMNVSGFTWQTNKQTKNVCIQKIKQKFLLIDIQAINMR